MTPIVSIPEPCQQDWDAMQPDAGGRHCAACSRTVIDFTDWEPDAIAAYLQAQAGTRVCGRFRADAVAPQPSGRTWLDAVFTATVPLLRKIAAAVLFFFGTAALSSCNLGKATPGAVEQHDTTLFNRPLLGESFVAADTVSLPTDDTAPSRNAGTIRKSGTVKICAPDSAILGDVEVVETMGAPIYLAPPIPADSEHRTQ